MSFNRSLKQDPRKINVNTKSVQAGGEVLVRTYDPGFV